ncbi:MAG TPA: ABC transporter permease [Arenicellales bacterium]|jgi:microcin C transport system permease protein|nr:ABC transporter permease [Gammaproteobacteria bacterium]MDP6026203.1 ABC transporter permease [Pseudomonadales bacterium]HJL52272.1 ABC transporter permease [Arenicellales bacterium]MDP6314932.1 ABC transporter permease [Pseudomonadales bacterium]MDP7314810.1 ABC transporter permease [Pseudomonadales bacterium]|tara:strand:- start:2235 stop:3275 length:1041 start_codon:yes stop_codon:yes gene_type:complete
MNPVTERRWRQFKSNRRGFLSLWIFGVLFSLSLVAELIANDVPIVMKLGGEYWFPVLQGYTEQDLGGELPIPAQYSDPFVLNLIEESDGWMLMPLIPFSYDTQDVYIRSSAPASPSMDHLLGTDDRARDTLARLVYGFRLSVLFGLSLTILSSAIGISVGALQGYFGGVIDLAGQRFVEIWAGLPILLTLIILASVVEPNVFWLLGILTMFSWMPLVGLVRAEFLRTRNFEFVRSARALGVNDLYIIRRHVLPNAMVAALTFLPFILSGAVTTLTALDFLGFGLPSGSPSLGELLAQGKNNLQAPWLGFSGFVTLGIMLTLLIFIGEAFRDAFDPRHQGTHTLPTN